MPEKDKNILKNNQDKKSFKNSFVIYANTEARIGKIHTCDNNQEEKQIWFLQSYWLHEKFEYRSRKAWHRNDQL